MGLVIHQANLKDFTKKTDYLRYMEKFAMQDIRHYAPIDIKKYLKYREIIVCNKSYGDIDSYEIYLYNEDYFLPSIKRMFQDWKRKYFRKVKKLYTQEDKVGFSKNVKNHFREAQEAINKANYLYRSEKAILKKFIRDFEDVITEYLDDPLPELKSKIEFNWNKHTLVYFFDLLRRNGVISKMKDSDLGRVIDDRFLFKEEDEYKIPKDSRKLLYALGDKGTKSSERSYEKLQELFSNPDFYNV